MWFYVYYSSPQARALYLGPHSTPGGAHKPHVFSDQGGSAPDHQLAQRRQGSRPQAQAHGQPGRPVQ